MASFLLLNPLSKRRVRTSRKGRIGSILLSAPVGLMAAGIILAVMMGCMSLSIGNRTVETVPTEEGVLCQQGEAHVPGNSSVFVHYPLPYPRKPNLEINCTFDDCTIGREDMDGFLLKNPNCLSRKVTWKARGLRCEPPSAPALPEPPPSAAAGRSDPATAPSPHPALDGEGRETHALDRPGRSS